MIKKTFYILIMILYIINCNISTIYSNNYNKNLPDVSASAAILMDMETGKILYSKNENEHHYPASITKILTTLIALEYNKPKDIITFSEEAVFGIDRSSSNLAMDVGEQITMEDALYSIMLMSANEVSAAVAEHIGGSIENFSKIMNQRAKQAGAINSNFKNPHGLHDDNHYTTAYDMAMIAKEAYKLPQFRKIISTITYQIQPTNKQPEIRYLANQHYMIKNTAYHYDACTGGKTGFTDEAQSTLVTFAEKDGLKLVCVVLDEKGNQKYDDTIALFDYGFENFKLQTLLVSDYPSSLNVYSQNDNENPLGSVNIYAENKNINTVINKDVDANDIKQIINVENKLIAPLEVNSIVGSVEYYYNDELICKTELKNLQEFKDIPVTNINNNIKVEHRNIQLFIIIIPILLFIILLLYIIRKKIKRRRGLYFRKRWF